MGLYSDLTDEELDAEIVEYRAKIRESVLGGELEMIAGEGRQMKARLLNLDEAKAALAEMLRERESPERTGVPRRGLALGVRILPL